MRGALPLLVVLLAAGPLQAQTAPAGFSAASAERQAALEAALLRVPDTASARAHARALTADPHVAGTPAQEQTAAYVLRAMAGYGLDTSRVTFRVFLPYPDSTIVERVTPDRVRLVLDERPLPSDPDTRDTPWPAMNGYSGAGDVTAPVVYVNYGLPDDYAILDSLGIDVRGKVVLARYGRSYRGIKAREAENRGAAAVLLYSDPQDDGYFRGDVYPDGPMRHPDAVQRGSINNGRGDPSTPGWASKSGARRLPRDSMAIPKIPVVPIGYRNAVLFLEGLDGPSVPQPWQGGLPFRYHIGAGAVTARVAIWPETGERAYKTISNTVATLRGSDWPDELVIAGGHRDAWGHGAVDNVTGIVSLLEAARAWGAAAKQGMRPRRTLVFATWDAEEWGLVGSVEYVESLREQLQRNAVAYLNQDVVAAGKQFGTSATASLRGMVRDVTRRVPAPGDSVSVYDAWRRDSRTDEGAEPESGDLGGGSDFAGFYNHLGIPSLDFGFGGPYGVYHSAYDTYTYLERFSDPGFLSHVAAGQTAALLLGRLANAEIVPFDFDEFGRYVGTLIADSRKAVEQRGWKLDYVGLAGAADSLAAAGARFSQARRAALARGNDRKRLARTNELLRGVERELTRPEGLGGREWFRNLVFAADRDNGYATVALPSIAEAMKDGDQALAQAEITDLAGRVRAAAARVERATAELGGR